MILVSASWKATELGLYESFASYLQLDKRPRKAFLKDGEEKGCEQIPNVEPDPESRWKSELGLFSILEVREKYPPIQSC